MAKVAASTGPIFRRCTNWGRAMTEDEKKDLTVLKESATRFYRELLRVAMEGLRDHGDGRSRRALSLIGAMNRWAKLEGWREPDGP
jgi:hypothetical protein